MMAWKLKTSPYKNAAPKLIKKEEWIPELSVGNLMQTCGNHIKASCAYMAFNVVTSGGGNLGILPVSTSGRLTDGLPQLPVHGDIVTDFDFSPFDDCLLATGSADNTVKIWLLPWKPEEFPAALPSLNACRSWTNKKRVENITWNPLADGILAASTDTSVKIYDVEKDSEKYDLNVHKDQVQSVCWHGDGGLLATSCKDKFLRVIDPRTESVVQEKEAFGNNRDSRVLWVGSNDAILTTGFDSNRSRKVHLWDSRNLQSSLYSTVLDTSTGTLMPLYDADTKMLFLIGKGETSVKICEVTEKSPYIVENFVARTEQVKGAALVPKRVLNVMDGEVDRLLLLTSSAVIPTPIIVPRKSYREFHENLFPDTPSGEITLSASEWLAGQNGKVKKTTLNPAFKTVTVTSNPGHLVLKGATSITSATINGSVKRESTPGPKPSVTQTKPKKDSLNKGGNSTSSNNDETGWNISNKTDEEKEELDKDTTDNQVSMATRNNQSAFQVSERPVAGKAFKSAKQSKYKHLKGQILHKSTHITNLRKINTTVPGESDMFHANRKFCVVPLEGAGGLLAILKLNKPDRLPNTGVPVLQHKSKVTDYVWDPFNDNRLVVACDDAKIWVWDIPEAGLVQTMTEPTFCLSGHMEKIYFVRFHPLAKDVLVSSSYDMSVRIWDLSTQSEVLQLEDHPDQVFCAAWSPDGKYLATVSKDGNIRIFNPRKYREPLLIGPGPPGSRGARVVWVLDGQYLFVSGFSRSNQRMIQMFDTANLEEPLDSVELEAAPSILIPYYDEDSHTVLLTGRGDNSVLAFEVAEEAPYLSFLSIYRPAGLHQAFSFLPRIACNVKEVEFAKAYRLTSNSIEPVSFTVPRVRMEYFQDDLFPDTKIIWEPSMTSQEWLSGSNKQQNLTCLKPDNMTPLSEAPVQAPKASKYDSYNPETYKTDEMKKEELLSAMTNKLSLDNTPLPQDLTEGVDSDEWEDD